jgi:hypothetical protein
MIMILLGAGLAGAIIPDRGIATRGLSEQTDVEHPEKATQSDLSRRPRTDAVDYLFAASEIL